MSVPRMITAELRQWRRESYGFSGLMYSDTRDICYDGEYAEIRDIVDIIEANDAFYACTALHTFMLPKVYEKKGQ